MSGELTLSQFKNTTTQNNDFVIGNPIPAGTTTDIADRYLVFQISDQIGPTHNPHIKAEKNIDGNWQIKLSDNGITDNNFAFLNSGTLSIPQLFVGINTFQGDVNFTGNVTTKNVTLGASSSDTITFLGSPVFTGPLTFNSAITFTNDVTINAPSKTVLITASSINIANKLITLNKGLDISAGGIGILTGDATSGTTPGYIKTNSDNTAWIVKAPISVGTITIQPSTTATDMLIRPAGGVFAANKILEVLPPFNNTTGIGYLGTYQFAPAGDRVILSTIAGFTESNTPSSKLAFLNNVTSDIQTQLGANNSVIYTLTSRVDNAESSLIVTNQTMATLSSTTANSIIALDSRMTNTEATVTTTLSTFASEISANSLATTTLSSQVNNATTGLPATYASLTTEMTTRATADTAEANARVALAATIPGIANAAATSAMTTYASYGIASATSVTDLTATVGINAATAHNELLAYVGPLGTTTSSITSLSTTVGSNTAAISSNTTSINGIEAKWGISIDNNGHISGISLNSGVGGISTFSVLANTFEFVDPTNGTNTITPFYYSSGVLHLDGSIVFSGTAIFNPAPGQVLSALTSDLGYPGTTTINGASITTGTLTASQLTTNLIFVNNNISSSNYITGTSTTTGIGWKISALTFPVTYMDGTAGTAQMELGGEAKIAGYRAAVIANNSVGGTTVWPSPGSYSWVCPDGVIDIEVTLQGAGSNGAFAGGNAGQYIRRSVSVIPGTSYPLVVGAHGTTGGSTSGFSMTAVGGAIQDVGNQPNNTNGTSTSGSETPEHGWNLLGGIGGGGSDANSGHAGNGGSCADVLGGNGATSTLYQPAGGGGGSSAMAVGGHGSIGSSSAGVGSYGSGGGGTGDGVGAFGGDGYIRIRY